MGIRTDTIKSAHTIYFGKVQPTDSWDRSRLPVYSEQFVFDLKDFPLDNLPSGGSSNRISPSEMIVAGLRLDNYEPRDDAGTIFFYRKNSDGSMTELFHYTGEDFKEQPDWTRYWSFDYAFVGNFSWEVNNVPGEYMVHMKYPQGDILIDFTVTNSAAAVRKAYYQTYCSKIACYDVWEMSDNSYSVYKLDGVLVGNFKSYSDATSYLESLVTPEPPIQPLPTPVPPVSRPPAEKPMRTVLLNTQGGGLIWVNGQSPAQITVVDGTELTFEAAPAAGWRFLKWVSADGFEVPGTPRLVVRVTANGSLTAVFEKIPEAEKPPVVTPVPVEKCPRGESYFEPQWPAVTCDTGYHITGDVLFFSDPACICDSAVEKTKPDISAPGEMGFSQIVRLLPTLLLVMVVASVIGAFRR